MVCNVSWVMVVFVVQDGATPLMGAARAGHHGIVEYLIMRGADHTVKDVVRLTCIYCGKRQGQHDTELINCTVRRDCVGSCL